jgi:hypothetical protein
VTDDLRQFLERVLGWADPRPVDRALQLVERAATNRVPLVLSGDRDRILVRIAHALHRRALGAGPPFVVADPRWHQRTHGLASYATVSAALEVAAGGVLCVRSRRPPRDFNRVITRLPDVGAKLVVCVDAAERCDVLLSIAEPIRVPPLASRRDELPKIVDAYATDARADLASSAPFTPSHRAWVMRHCASLPAIELTVRRLVALQRAGSIAGAAALLGMGHTALGEWFALRRGLQGRLAAGRRGVFTDARSRYSDPKLMDEAGNEALQEAIKHMHGCGSTWVESVPVNERFDGEVVWAGEVQVFDLIGHPQATRAYAWSHATEGTKRRFYAVLGIPPIVDALTAVRASIVAAVDRGVL